MNFEFIEDTYDYRYENINIDRTVEINCNIDSLEFKYKLFKFFFCFSQETKLNLFQMKYKICLVLYLKKLLFMCNPFYKKKYIFYREEKSDESRWQHFSKVFKKTYCLNITFLQIILVFNCTNLNNSFFLR